MGYEPKPIEVEGVALTAELRELTERLARNAHEAWARRRLEEGWRLGPRRDDATREHPCLVPYEELPESEKEYDRRVALGTVKALLAFGYRIERPRESGPEPPAAPSSEVTEALGRLRDPAGLTLRDLLALWSGRHPEEWAQSPEPFARLGERILRLGAPLPAHDVLAAGLAEHPADVRLRQLQGLALARSGAAGRANEILRGLVAEGHADSETLGILARTFKDLSAAAASEEERRALLGQAHAHYLRAYHLAVGRGEADGALYTGINAASTALLLEDALAAGRLAGEVRGWCERRLARSADYWAEATLGEAALILGEWEDAERRYARAAALGRTHLGDLSTTRRQARLLLRHLHRDPAQCDHCFQIGSVVVFSGHRIDAPARPTPRFPPSLEAAVAAALAERLDAVGAAIGFASAAPGADIQFLEAVRARGGDVHVVLPYGVEQFRKDQGDVSGAAGWAERLDRVLAQAAEVVVTSEQAAPESPIVFAYANTFLYGWAKLRAEQLETELVPLAVWDGQPGDGPGGTADSVRSWQARGHRVELIRLEELLRPARGGGRPTPRPARADRPEAGTRSGAADQRVMAMLFADAVGYSKLTEAQVLRFMERFLGAIAGLVAAGAAAQPPFAPVAKNTWGDGLYFVFASARDAGRFALALCERVNGTDWAAHGLPALLSLRVALHAGPVFAYRNPVTGQEPDYSGTHVSRAARIEPITPPGHVYASQPFAALAAAEGATDFGCDYVGQTPLAKGYGTFPTYHVRRA